MNGVVSIPNGWEETTLGEVINIIGGGTPKTKIPEYWDGEIPWLSVVDFNNDNRWVSTTEKSITELGLNKSSTKLLNVGDIIISARGTVGAMAQLKREMAFNQSCYGIKEVEDVSDKDFLFYLIKYSLKKINRNTYGAVFDTITTKTFDVININLPPLPEQKAIANILTAFDDKIENLQSQNETLEQTAQNIFKEWYGKYKNKNEIPQDMTLGSLDDFISELESGKRPKGGVGQFMDGIPSVGAENVKNLGVYDFSKTKYVPEEFFNKMSSGIVKDYDILIYKDGGTPGTFIPHFTIVGEGFPFSKFCINEHVFRIQPKFEYQRFYLYGWLDSYYCRKLLQNIGGKAAIPGINSSDLREIEMLIPSEESLKHFHKVVQPMYKKLLINSRNINTLQKTRDTLLPKLVSGKLRVNGFKN